MNPEWADTLRRLERDQADLRQRLERLDDELARLRARMTAPEEPVPVCEPPPLPPRVVEPPTVPPAPEPVGPPPLPAAARGPRENLELRVGQYWLVRIGVVVLLTGLVLLGNLAYRNFIVPLGAAGQLGLLYLAGAALLGGGLWLERKMARMHNYARVLMAGGGATWYYATYAAHFVKSLQVISSPILAGALLLALAGGLTWFAVRRRRESVAFTALLLTYYTSAINPAAGFTAFSNVLLTVVAVVLLVRCGWGRVSWLALAGSYLGFAYWRIRSGTGGPDVWSDHGVLIAYWAIFTLAVFLRRAGTFSPAQRTTFLTVNNGAFFVLMAPAVASGQPQQFWIFAVVFGAVLVALAIVAGRLKPGEPFFDGAYLTQGLVVLAIGFVTRFTGYERAMIFLVESTVLLVASRYRHRLVLLVASSLAGLAALGLLIVRSFWETPHGWILFLLATAGFLLNAWLRKAGRGPAWDGWAAGYAFAATVSLALVFTNRFTDASLVWAFCAGAVGLTAMHRLLRLPEAAFFAVIHLGIAAGLAAVLGVFKNFDAIPPVLGVSLVLMHVWQRGVILRGVVARVIEGFAAFVFCALVVCRLAPEWTDSTQWLALAAAGLSISTYAIFTRAWFLAAFGQVVLFWQVAVTLVFMACEPPPWHVPVLLAVGIVLQLAIARAMPEAIRATLRPLEIIYHVVILVLAASCAYVYVPESGRFLVLMVFASLTFVFGAVRRDTEALVYAAGFLVLATGLLAGRILFGEPWSGADFVGLLLMLGIPSAGRRLIPDRIPSALRHAISIVAMLGLWAQLSGWVWDGERAVAVTVVWALLALGLLGLGFLLRERAYRLGGLVILAVAVGHVFFVDVWKMGRVAGILGILALAVILLGLGFIYNRFAEHIRRFL